MREANLSLASFLPGILSRTQVVFRLLSLLERICSFWDQFQHMEETYLGFCAADVHQHVGEHLCFLKLLYEYIIQLLVTVIHKLVESYGWMEDALLILLAISHELILVHFYLRDIYQIVRECSQHIELVHYIQGLRLFNKIQVL